MAALWEKRKGIEDVVKISEKLSRDYQMVVIGVDKSQEVNLPNHVIAINRTNNVYVLRAWYSLADIYINPTYEDNYPTTNLEAIVYGTPVITYDTGGSGESAEECGCVVKQGSIKELIQGINQTLSFGLTVENRRKQAILFSKENCSKDYEMLFENAES